MSRSYREPWVVDGYGSKNKVWEKRRANKAVRRAKFVGNGMYYKRIYDSWSICDYKFWGGKENEKIWWNEKYWQIARK